MPEIVEILALSLLLFPLACFGVQAMADRLMKKRYPDMTPEERTETIKSPSRAICHLFTFIPLLYAVYARTVGRCSLWTEFVYVGITTSTHALYGWEDGKIPHADHAPVFLSLFLAFIYAIHIHVDALPIQFAVVYSCFGVLWLVIDEIYAMMISAQVDFRFKRTNVDVFVRAIEIAAMQFVALLPLYRTGTGDHQTMALVVFLHGIIYVGARRRLWR